MIVKHVKETKLAVNTLLIIKRKSLISHNNQKGKRVKKY